ncbi:hypothetical protein FOL47_001931 [Perkinsus chesapeaki]|uniref:Uncharacterized protein n=1 Tax=Perkinsus chesapeaki TaxID=330153 RepID=A0A7J6MG87_PERCH|nr:hypothetical protein FOL47_001931 [Perkinsus chesapeaki]
MLNSDMAIRHLVRRAVSSVQQDMEGEKLSLPSAPERSEPFQHQPGQPSGDAGPTSSFGARNRYEPIWRALDVDDGQLEGDVEDQLHELHPPQTYYLDESGHRWSTIPCPERCLAYGPGVAGGPCGELLELTVNTVNADRSRIPTGGNNVSLLLRPKDPTLAIGEYKAWSMDCEDGSYKLRYDCSRPGAYYLDVTVNGGHVCGSPFNAVMRPGKVEAQHCIIISGSVVPTSDGASLALPDTAIGLTHELWIETCDSCGNRSYDPCGVFGARPVGAVRVTDVTDCETGVFVVAFTIVAGGPGRLDLLFNAEHIGSSPLWVEVEEPPKAREPAKSHGVLEASAKAQPKDPLMVLEEKEARIRQMTVRLERLKRETDAKARESRRLMTERFQELSEAAERLPEPARRSLQNLAEGHSVAELARMVSEVSREREIYRERNALVWEALHKLNDSWLEVEKQKPETVPGAGQRGASQLWPTEGGGQIPGGPDQKRRADGDWRTWPIPRTRPNMAELFQRGAFAVNRKRNPTPRSAPEESVAKTQPIPSWKLPVALRLPDHLERLKQQVNTPDSESTARSDTVETEMSSRPRRRSVLEVIAQDGQSALSSESSDSYDSVSTIYELPPANRPYRQKTVLQQLADGDFTATLYELPPRKSVLQTLADGDSLDSDDDT